MFFPNSPDNNSGFWSGLEANPVFQRTKDAVFKKDVFEKIEGRLAVPIDLAGYYVVLLSKEFWSDDLGMKVKDEYQIKSYVKEHFEREMQDKYAGKPCYFDFWNVQVLHNPNNEFSLVTGEVGKYAAEKEVVSYVTYEFGKETYKKKTVINQYIYTK